MGSDMAVLERDDAAAADDAENEEQRAVERIRIGEEGAGTEEDVFDQVGSGKRVGVEARQENVPGHEEITDDNAAAAAGARERVELPEIILTCGGSVPDDQGSDGASRIENQVAGSGGEDDQTAAPSAVLEVAAGSEVVRKVFDGVMDQAVPRSSVVEAPEEIRSTASHTESTREEDAPLEGLADASDGNQAESPFSKPAEELSIPPPSSAPDLPVYSSLLATPTQSMTPAKKTMAEIPDSDATAEDHSPRPDVRAHFDEQSIAQAEREERVDIVDSDDEADTSALYAGAEIAGAEIAEDARRVTEKEDQSGVGAPSVVDIDGNEKGDDGRSRAELAGEQQQEHLGALTDLESPKKADEDVQVTDSQRSRAASEMDLELGATGQSDTEDPRNPTEKKRRGRTDSAASNMADLKDGTHKLADFASSNTAPSRKSSRITTEKLPAEMEHETAETNTQSHAALDASLKSVTEETLNRRGRTASKSSTVELLQADVVHKTSPEKTKRGRRSSKISPVKDPEASSVVEPVSVLAAENQTRRRKASKSAVRAEMGEPEEEALPETKKRARKASRLSHIELSNDESADDLSLEAQADERDQKVPPMKKPRARKASKLSNLEVSKDDLAEDLQAGSAEMNNKRNRKTSNTSAPAQEPLQEVHEKRRTRTASNKCASQDQLVEEAPTEVPTVVKKRTRVASGKSKRKGSAVGGAVDELALTSSSIESASDAAHEPVLENEQTDVEMIDAASAKTLSSVDDNVNIADTLDKEVERIEEGNKTRDLPSSVSSRLKESTIKAPAIESNKTGSFSGTGEVDKELLIKELKAMKMQQILARNASLTLELATKRQALADVTAVLDQPAAATVKKHIKLLHDYNDIKDVGQGLLGMIADGRGVRVGEIYEEFGVALGD